VELLKMRPLLGAAVAALSLGHALGAAGASSSPRAVEYAVKAAFLYQFARFVEWPPSSPAASGPVRICVIGDDPFGDALDLATQDKRVTGRPLSVRRYRGIADLKPCAIVFVPGPDPLAAAAVAHRLRGSATLIVGEAPEFRVHGGMIAFRVERDVVRFDINQHAAETEGIRISARLLGLAASGGDAETAR
jgi:hypothetical protein